MLNKSIENTINEALWKTVPEQAIEFAKRAAPQAFSISEAIIDMPTYGYVYYFPVEKEAYIVTDKNSEEIWKDKLSKVANLKVAVAPPVPPNPSPRVPIANSNIKARDVFGPIASFAGWREGPTANLFGGPNTLSAAIGTGLLGAGVGYGAGWLGELLAGDENLKKGRLRNSLALLGGAAGTMPALWAGYNGWFKQSSCINIPNPLKEGYKDLVKSLPSNIYIKTLEKKSDDGWLPGVGFRSNINRMLDPSSYSTTGAFGEGYWEPTIPKDNFNQAIWNDPMTPTSIRAGAAGLVSGASAIRGGDTWVSPADIARVAVGMGSGYVSGKIVGKALGALAGLQPKAQERLQDAGIWAGLLTNVIPKAFGN